MVWDTLVRLEPQIEKKIGDLYELDNFKQKIFFEKKFAKLR